VRRLPLLLAALALAGCGDDGGDGADLDRRLLAAAYADDVAAARALIADGADVNFEDGSQQSAYLIATSEVGPGTELLELTLEGGAEVDAKDSFNGTGLIRAAERGHAAICKRLIEAGIDKDHVNRLGWTALLEAVMLGDGGRAHVETVRVLVDGGVDTSIADGQGVTPLEHAERRGYEAIARILRQTE
jgi:ankyrin repeat protein